LNSYMFRAYDIRGIVGQDLNVETSEIIGKGIGSYFRNKKSRKLVVGRDNRPSSKDLTEAMIKGLVSTGCHVTDIGQSTTPLLSFTLCDQHFDGGINVTGSHNPVEYNGYKIGGRDAYPVAEEDISEIRDLVFGGKFTTEPGKVTTYSPFERYFSRLENFGKIKRSLKVVVDTGNGVGGLVAPEVLRRIGCDVVELHCDLDGTFPHHLPNPEKEENVEDLKKAVIQHKADIGVAFDGDGDRLGLVDEQGRYREADFTIIMLARDFLSRNPKATVVIDVKVSKNVINEIEKYGGVPVLYKTGHSLIKRKMWEEGILLAGELSGHMYVAENYYIIDDALLAACRILRVLAGKAVPLSQHFADIPELCSTRLIELPCEDSEKFDVVKQLAEEFSERYSVNNVDGARIDFGGGWAIVRASNTTPSLTLRFEADTEEILGEIKSIVYQALKRFPSVKSGGDFQADS
jgi:phosphomannomutase/phosphoglucomutase